MARISSRGNCLYCTKDFSKAGMTKHLAGCQMRKLSLEKETGKKKKIFHLVVEGYSVYWLHLELAADIMLSNLDKFLRDIWLECCGHMSHFRIADRYFSSFVMDDDLPMTFKLSQLVHVGDKFLYEYDMGTTTELTIKVVAEREGAWSGKKLKFYLETKLL